ncbi:hypothetical protein [Streptomyces sp. NPDC057854]|uniref:hypothetical protein n=1 Tax=unclassified Streptomyces TaxID=2593676 RepID=UPI0036992237
MGGEGREKDAPRTTPSEAVGESGDAQARREAEEAMLGPRRASHTDKDHDQDQDHDEESGVQGTAGPRREVPD